MGFQLDEIIYKKARIEDDSTVPLPFDSHQCQQATKDTLVSNESTSFRVSIVSLSYLYQILISSLETALPASSVFPPPKRSVVQDMRSTAKLALKRKPSNCQRMKVSKYLPSNP